MTLLLQLQLLVLLTIVRCELFVATVPSSGLTVRVTFGDEHVGVALSMNERLFLGESHVTSAAVHHNNQWLVPGQGLRLVDTHQTANSLTLHWRSLVGAEPIDFTSSVEILSDAVLFRQRFERGVNASVLPGDERRLERPCTQWPSFSFAPGIAALWWSAMFDMGTFSSVPEHDFVGGAASGVPLVLFHAESLDTIVVSPAAAFKSTVLGNHRGTLVVGVGGTFLSIPAGHVTETVIVGRRCSFIGALYAWGDVLLERGGKKRTRHEQSVLATLGYATDNGAVYHYHAEPNKTYAQTLIQLKQWCDENNLPLRYVQLDSWWYDWNDDHGVDDWRPRADERTFPDGVLPDLGLPYQLHNRFFSRTTKMSKWYAFAESDPARSKRPMAFPRAANNNQYRLYSEWMSRARKRYHIAVYEQDWMAPQVLDMPYPLEVLGEADMWLEAMGRAASENGIVIMYCMPLRADYLISTRIAAVQAVRVGRDYANWLILRLPTWQIFVTSILADALGLMVIKDTFWSVERQPSFVAGRRADRANDHGENATETSPALMALISVLSAGQVAPGDSIGCMNVSLLMRTCDANGTLLRPDRPALPTPDFFRRVPSAAEMTSDVLVFAPAINSVQVLAINVTGERSISLDDMELASDVRLLASRVGTTGGDWHVDDRFQLVDNEHPLIVSSQQRSVAPFVLTFDYWLLSRSLGMCNGVEVFFLGERTTKFVALSRDRFRRIVLNESTCTLTVDVHVWYKEQVVLQVAKQMQSNRSVSVVERTMSGNDPQFERRFGEQWIEVQTRTFTKWINATLRQHLGKGAPVITQLPRAFRDGIILFKLAAALYPHAEQPNYNKAPKMRPQAIDNVSMALKLIEKHGPELRFTQVEQLVDCDPKMTLGMVWSIVHHHQIRAIQVGALHGKDGLLLWCKRIAQPHGVEIANFTTSWRDGAAFTCIVATLVGEDKLPLAPVLDQRVSGAARDHLANAFAVAEAELGVPQLLTPEDLLDERPDEKSVLTYVSELFRVGASRTTHSSAFEPEDGGAVLGAILAWQKSESDRRVIASSGADSDVDRWRALAQQRSAYIQRWANDVCAALDAAAAISTSKAPLRDIRNVVQKQLGELSPARHISALLGRLRQQSDRDDSVAIEALRSADVALERVKVRLAADGGDDARSAPPAAAATAGPTAANNPEAQAALSVYNDQVSALLSALAVTRSAANGLASAADENKETVRGDLQQLQAESQERAAALLEAPLETLQQLTQLDAHHADMHRRAGESLRAFVAETDAFVEFCIAQCER